jgi:hypothetical protein
MIPYDPAEIGCQSRLLVARHRLTGSGAAEGTNALWRRLAVLLVVLALAGCASMAAGPGQTPNAPYQQSDPRDTSGMH